MIALVAVIAGVLGLAVGSFLNVVIHRVPAGQSIRRQPSSCPNCGHRIRWYDNIPVASWLALRGRCRDCGTPISVRYPLIELAGAAAFVLVALAFAPGGWFAPEAAEAADLIAQFLVLTAFLVFSAASIALTAIDIEVRRLPDRIVLPTAIVLALAFAGAAAIRGDLAAIGTALLAAAACFAFFFLIAFIRPGGMGFGDVKLAISVGLATGWIGWSAVVVGVFAGFLLGGLFGIALMLARRAGRRSAIPYGPWLLAGAWVGIAAGPAAWTWYSSVLGLA